MATNPPSGTPAGSGTTVTAAAPDAPHYVHHGNGHHSHKHEHPPHGHHHHRHHHAGGEQEHTHGPEHTLNPANAEHTPEHHNA